LFYDRKLSILLFMAAHNTLGQWGEDVAAKYLISKGWYIRDRNWRNHHREIDIVCIDEDMTTLLIVEVKTRSSDAFGQPDEAISSEKRHNIVKAAQDYAFSNYLAHLTLRYDTISVVGTPETGYTIEHKEGAYDVLSQFLYNKEDYKKHLYHNRNRSGLW